ncbi:MAG: hypothetical protein CMA35_00005 [Euryarchaeota archaeon]|nr:hypothetical protein [Euryarchaeota archaeon]
MLEWVDEKIPEVNLGSIGCDGARSAIVTPVWNREGVQYPHYMVWCAWFRGLQWQRYDCIKNECVVDKKT